MSAFSGIPRMLLLAVGMTLTAGLAVAANAPAMTSAEIMALLSDKTLFMVDRAQGRSYGNLVRMYFGTDGSLVAHSSSGMSNSGTWEVKEDGLMCNTWRNGWRDGWCYTLHRDDDEVNFIATKAWAENFTGLKWVMKSSKDGNHM